MNNYSAIGRIAMDPKKGNGVVNSLLAIKRIYKSSDNVDTDFVPLTIFGHQADNFDRLTKEGDRVGIDGSVKTSKYADENGEVHYGWSVVVNHFYLLSSKPHNDASPKLSDATFTSLSPKIKDSDLPF
ncbi:single-stranded DNA-binding protein [Lacticaseibacillus paracasei]|uniref:single-stranded DNA-binding protein n=1 Tax=Lacticaseibacillus paracasei TaxID=1597 RepID=UPI000BC32800|nr:single-stranded DNA-binding protein [Lacticaseibacillus paracasei]ATG98907.1 single-stranded DNA-binding protein [Lacticaseibacillus paracasei]RND78246.1 Single-stranded DNA-binding protein SsbB [Lacticaseibacillus paracasei]RND85056.1 Single-stranded DNA-binding protein SsbB [Lacticaseibacillus paracasei]